MTEQDYPMTHQNRCPQCGVSFINRNHGRCRRCNTLLILTKNELKKAEDGAFIWGTYGWEPWENPDTQYADISAHLVAQMKMPTLVNIQDCHFSEHMVLDPFIGSGSTALAADRLGRDCIGIDAAEDAVRVGY